MDDADREADAVHPRQHRRVEVLRVLAHGEDGGTSLSDPLALDEVRIDARGAVNAGIRQLLRDLARPLVPGLDQPDADPLVEQDSGDRHAGRARAEDDDVVHGTRAARHDPTPFPGRVGRADDDDSVPGLDGLVPARHQHPVPADDAGHLRVGGNARLAKRTPDHMLVRARQGPLSSALGSLGEGDAGEVLGTALARDIELDDLHLTVGEDVGLLSGRHADGARDGVRRLELGGDHEVHLDLVFLPGLDVLRVRGPHDRLRLGELLRQRSGDEVDLVPRRAGDHEVRSGDAGVLEDAARGPVPSDRANVVPVGERLQPGRIEINHRDVVLLVQRLADGGADLAGSEEDDLHESGD